MTVSTTQGKNEPRTKRTIELWTGDLHNKGDRKYIDSELILDCCEIEKAPDLGTHLYRAEVFFRFPNGTGRGRTFVFELDTNEVIEEIVSPNEDSENVTLNMEVTKTDNKVAVECALWYTLTVYQRTNKRLQGREALFFFSESD